MQSLHLIPDNPANIPPLFFTGWMPFLPPNQQRQSTEGKFSSITLVYKYELLPTDSKNQLIINNYNSHN